MKRSKQITLVLSGAMATWPLGCEKFFGPSAPPLPPPPVSQAGFLTGEQVARQVDASQTYTNNHYVPHAGYYHAPYHSWFPYPYNYSVPGRGFYHGGAWTPAPHLSPLTTSQPGPAAVNQARAQATGLTRSSGSSGFRSGSSGSGFSRSGSSSSTSRGGFGSSSHSSGS